MSICVYADKQVCMYARMDRRMDARIHVRNVVCIKCMFVEVCVICVGICTVILHI